MRVIWKYDISREIIRVPIWSKVLCVQLQDGEPQIWMLVDTEEKVFERRRFIVIGTGQSFNSKDMNYIGTYQQGIFVWHVFEINRRGDK